MDNTPLELSWSSCFCGNYRFSCLESGVCGVKLELKDVVLILLNTPVSTWGSEWGTSGSKAFEDSFYSPFLEKITKKTAL
ncbi:hypothetical protein E2320_016506 [Naja naja]|nr:hypothetical protein E2320_016506 [Naja naja]